MSKWETATLADVGTFQAGVGFPLRLQGLTNGQYPFAKVGDISRVARAGKMEINTAENFVDQPTVTVMKVKPLPIGTILFAKIGEAIRQNFKVITSAECLIDNNVMGLIPNTSKVETRYLFHFLRKIDIYRLAEKTTVPSIRKSTLEKVSIPLPPLPEQKRIAEILDRTQSLISKRKEAIAKLDTLNQSIFLEMFGDPVENNRDWSKLNFAEISPEKGLIVDGPFGSTLKPDSYVETGVRVIRNFNINDASFDGSKFVYITRNKFSEIYRSHVCTNDILISTKGTIGDVCLMPDLSGDSVLSASGTVRIRLPVNSPLLPYFVVYQMIQPHYKQYIKSFEAGSNQKYLNLSQIRKMELIVPPLAQQKEFAQRIKAVEKLKATHLASLRQLQALFASLQHRAFRGEL